MWGFWQTQLTRTERYDRLKGVLSGFVVLVWGGVQGLAISSQALDFAGYKLEIYIMFYINKTC
jgi:hypothetical protein